MLTEEERRFLAEGSPARLPKIGTTPDWLMDAEAGINRDVLSASERAFLAGEDDPTPPEPTVSEKGRHLGARWLSGALDVLDMPAYIQEGRDTVRSMFPNYGASMNAMDPLAYPKMRLRMALQDVPGGEVLSGDARATDVVPGLTQARELTERNTLTDAQLDQAPYTQATGKGLEWFGVPGAGTTASVVKGTVRALPDATRMLSREFGDAATTATLAGGGSGAADYVSGGEYGTAGELSGGLVSMLVNARRGRGGITNAERNMLQELEKRFADDPAALDRVAQAIQNGEIGTLTDLSGVESIADLEAALNRTYTGNRQLRATGDARQAQISEGVMDELNRDIPEGTTGQTSIDAAERQLDRNLQDIDQAEATQLTQAVEKAEAGRVAIDARVAEADATARAARGDAIQQQQSARQAEEELLPSERPDQYSGRAAERFDAEKKAHSDESAKLWQTFDNGPAVDATPLRQVANDEYAKLSKTERDLFDKEYGDLLAPLRKWDKPFSARDISLRIQEIKEAYGKAEKTGWREQKLKDVYEAMEKELARVNGDYRAAVASTREGYARFGNDYIGDVRGRATDEEFLSQAGMQGDRGSATARQLLRESKIPGMQEDVGNFILAEARRARTLDEQWASQYEAVLDNLPPEYRERLQAVMAQRQGVEASAAQADRLEKAAAQEAETGANQQTALTKALEGETREIETAAEGLRKTQRSSTLAQYSADPDQADAVVDELLTRPDGAERLSDLLEGLQEADMAQGGAGVMESFRARLRDRLGRRLFETFEPGADASTLRVNPRAFDEFRQLRYRLMDNGLMTEAEFDRTDDLLSRIQTEALRRQGKANVGDVTSAGDEFTGLQSSALASAVLGWLPGAYNLQLGGAARRYFKAALEDLPSQRQVEALTEYMTNPAAFMEGLDKLRSPEARAQFVMSKFIGAGQAAEAIAADEEEE